MTGQARVMLEVMRHGPVARSELARALQLSPASLTRIVAPLVDAGLLRETGQRVASGVGRPTRPLDVVPGARHFAGIKVTQEAAHGVLTDLRADVRRAAERPLADLSPEAVAGTVTGLANELGSGTKQVTAIGVSLGGPVIDHSLVLEAPFLGWGEVRFGKLLAERSGLPVAVDNDVVALTRAEQWFGIGRTAERFVVLTVGAGLGYGLVVHDRVVDGVEAGIGTLGHHPVDPQGARCAEGHRGCAAVTLTSSSMARAVSLGLDRSVGYEAALDLATDGDPVAGAVVSDAGRALGRLVAAVSNVVMTDRVVLAGEGSRLAVVARAELDAEVRAGRHPHTGPLQLEVRDTGNEQWARGAAVSAIQAWATAPNGP